MDGLLWFPFKALAKLLNYSGANEVADARIANLISSFFYMNLDSYDLHQQITLDRKGCTYSWQY